MRRLQEIASKLLLLILLIWFAQDCSQSAAGEKTNLRRLSWFGWGDAEEEDVTATDGATKTVEEETAPSYEYTGLIESVACEPDHAKAVQFVSQFGPLDAGNEDCAAHADPDSCGGAGGCCRFGDYFFCDTNNDFPELPCVCGRNTKSAQEEESSTSTLTSLQAQAIQAINKMDPAEGSQASYLDGWGDNLPDDPDDSSNSDSIEDEETRDGELGNETVALDNETLAELAEVLEEELSSLEEDENDREGDSEDEEIVVPTAKIDADTNFTEVTWKPTYDVDVNEKSGVLKVLGEEEWEAKIVNSNKVSVVAFIVPWCHGCEELSPQYEEAAKELTDDEVQFVWFDVTDAKNGNITKEFNLTRFPTVVVIQDGSAKDRSQDDRYEGLHLAVHFLNNFLAEDGDVEELDDMETHLHVERSFEEGLYGPTARNGPTSDGVVKTVLGEDQWTSDVVYNPLLTMVAFTAPWCPGCQALHPEYDAAASQLMGQEVELVWVDATDPANAGIVSQYDVTGYPKIVILPAGSPKDSTRAEQYQGARTASDLMNAIHSALGSSGTTQSQPQPQPAPALPQPAQGVVSTADEVATDRDGSVSDGFVNVVHGPEEWTSEVVTSPLLTMVAFVSPSQSLSQDLQSQYVLAASQLIGKEVQLVWVDATDATNAPFVQLYHVTEYPKIIIQPAGSPKDSGQSHNYVGAHTAVAIASAMMTELGGSGAVQEQAMTNVEINRDGQTSDGMVDDIQGEERWISEVVNSPLLTLVVFGSPNCPICQALRPQYDAAAAQLLGEEVQLVWVDATSPENAPFIQLYAVAGYPKIMILPAGSPKQSSQAQQYLGPTTTDDIVFAVKSTLGSSVVPQQAQQVPQPAAPVAPVVATTGSNAAQAGPTSDGLVKTVLGQDQWTADVVYNPLLTMVAFTAPWCPGCQAFHPEYDNAAAQLAGRQVQLVGWMQLTQPMQVLWQSMMSLDTPRL